MTFYHQGKKKSNEIGVASGCVLFIGFGAFIFFLSLLKDVDDIKDYLLEIILFIIMAGSLFFSLFARKGKIANKHITIKNNFFSVDKLNVRLEEIRIDYYIRNDKFNRYFLRDSHGKLAIFSVYEDDLIKYFLENFPLQVATLKEVSSIHKGPYITVISEQQKLYYDLERGKYTLKKESSNISHVPDIFDYDAKYKLGKPLLKKK